MRLGLSIVAGPSGAGGYPALDLTGLAVLAQFDLANAASVWSDTSRTTPATIGGTVRGLTDLSGNGNHATFGGNAVWSGEYAKCLPEVPASNLISIPNLAWNTQNISVTMLWEPVCASGGHNNLAYLATHSLANAHIAWYSQNTSNGGVNWNGSAATIGLPQERMAWTVKWGSTARKVYRDAASATLASAFGSTNYTGLYLGNPVTPAQSLNGYAVRHIIVTDATTATDSRIGQLHTDLKAQWTNVAPTTSVNYAMIGDSLTIGYGSSLNPWWKQLRATNATTRWWSCSITGLPFGGGATPPIPEPQMGTITKAIIWLGFNDANGSRTSSQILADAATLVGRLGSTPYLFLTIPPNTALGGSKLTAMNDANAGLLLTYGANCLDTSTLGLVTGSADYYDTVHLTAQGQRKIAVGVATKLGLSAPL